MISQTDIIIYEALKAGLQDVRQNLWLIDDIFSALKNPNFITSFNGPAEIEAIKLWFSSADIPVLLKYRVDKETFPCVTIALGNSVEKDNMRHLGDLSTETEILTPAETGKPIPYIIKPFVPEEIDLITGKIKAPSELRLRGVRKGQLVVDVDTGYAVKIKKIEKNTILFDPDDNFNPSKIAIAPEYPYYVARREHTFFQENVTIACHVSGDPIQAMWLSSIVIYVLLRFRETLLEGKYYTESAITISDLIPNEEYGGASGDLVYSRYITMSGQIEYSWLKQIKRVVEAIELENYRNEDDIGTGIKFLSNENSQYDDDIENASWTTVEDDNETE